MTGSYHGSVLVWLRLSMPLIGMVILALTACGEVATLPEWSRLGASGCSLWMVVNEVMSWVATLFPII